MDERARDVKGEEPQEPENQEDHEDRPEHCCLLIPGDSSGRARVFAGLFAKIEPPGPTSTVSQDPGSRPWQASNQQCADRPGPPLGRTLASCGMLFPKERKKERKGFGMRTKPVFVLTLLLAGALAATAEEKKAPWKVSGQLEEACSCDAACPCWFDSKPTKMTCGGGQVIFIEKGSYGDVPLDGLAFASMGQSPEGKSMMESIGNWNFFYLYIDEKANPEQRKGLEAIARAPSPAAAPPERTMVRYAPITRKIEGTEHVVSLGKYGSFS